MLANAQRRTSVEIAAQLNALPDHDRELSALAKIAPQARVAHEEAALEHLEAERHNKEAPTRYVMESLQGEGKRNVLLRDLEMSASPELADAPDDRSFTDELFRMAVHTAIT
jgi:hypothetical protein